MTYGEGPTQMKKSGGFMEDEEVCYTPQDIRFTTKDDVIYAICLGWPREPVTIRTLKALYVEEIAGVNMLGVEQPLTWTFDRQVGLNVIPPEQKPCENAFVLKIKRRRPY